MTIHLTMSFNGLIQDHIPRGRIECYGVYLCVLVPNDAHYTSFPPPTSNMNYGLSDISATYMSYMF